jgi:predicted NBD/HSP70 family sugar kinase
MNGKLFFDAANAAEPEALEVLERFCKMVAVQIYNLTVLLDVEKVAIGGGISKQPLLLDDLRRVYAGLFASRGESPYMIGLPRCEIVPCHFSSEANQVGALYTYLQAESKTI